MNLQTKNKITLLFKQNRIKPIRFIQGDENANILQSSKVSRLFYKKSTALFEAYYDKTKVVVKVYIDLKGNKLRFLREKYCYLKAHRQNSNISQLFPRLLLHKREPFSFLVLEKIKGIPLGDWYHVRNIEPEEVKHLLLSIKKIHTSFEVPKYLAYPKLSNPNYFFKKNKKIKKTLKKYPFLNFIWKKLKKQETKFKKIYKKTGFIFSDLSPSNIFINKKEIKFIDLETASMGNLFYDFATLSFAFISNKKYFKLIQSEIKKFFISSKKDIYLLNFFLLWYSLFNLHFYPEDPRSHLELINKLEKRLNIC